MSFSARLSLDFPKLMTRSPTTDATCECDRILPEGHNGLGFDTGCRYCLLRSYFTATTQWKDYDPFRLSKIKTFKGSRVSILSRSRDPGSYLDYS